MSKPNAAPVDRTLLVELAQSTPEHGPFDEREPIETEPVTALSEEIESGPATEAAAEPSRPDTPESKESSAELRLSPADVRRFVRSYESSEGRLESLRFRPDLRRRLEAREAEQRKVALVNQNRTERFGHSAEIVNARDNGPEEAENGLRWCSTARLPLQFLMFRAKFISPDLYAAACAEVP